MIAPIVVVLLVPAMLPRGRCAGRVSRASASHAIACGLLAAGIATLLHDAVERILGEEHPQRLTLYTPLIEEPMKALAVVAVIGFAAVARSQALPAWRCVIATLTVVATFAAAENLGYVIPPPLAAGPPPGDWSMTMETLRIRAILPPLGHLAETWPVAAALWLAGRRPRLRLPILLTGLAAAIACHAVWNASVLRWWPDPRPLLVILAGSATAATACWAASTWHRRSRPGTAAPVPAPTSARQPAATARPGIRPDRLTANHVRRD